MINTAELPQPGLFGSVLLITRNPILGPALEAALTSVGWQVTKATTLPFGAAARRLGAAYHIVLVADGAGRLPDLPAERPLPGTCIAVGFRVALAGLIRAMAQGAAAAVDADQPFTGLVGQLHLLLLTPPSSEQTVRSARRLDARAAAASRFDTLTRRERQVLIALVQGWSAAQIAGLEYLSLSTVRSHIQSVLVKLDSSSQLAAVALTHRVCADREIVRALRELHQF
jgi:DNA-binding NarL/FixJ family response regulator